MGHRVFRGNALAAASDDDGQFGLVIDRRGDRRHLDGGAGTDHGLRHLGEDDGVRRNVAARFGAAVKAAAGKLFRVRKVVFSDAENIAARPGQRGDDLHLIEGEGGQQGRQGVAARLHLDQRLRPQVALRFGQIKGLDLLEVGGHQAHTGAALQAVGNNFHGAVSLCFCPAGKRRGGCGSRSLGADS